MYRFLPHRSDLIVQGENTTFEKALSDVAEGMFTNMGSEHATAKHSLEFDVKQENEQDLVVAALTAIIGECEAEQFVPKKADFTKIAGGLHIKLNGEKKPSQNIIKAVTYHELSIEKPKNKKENWKVTVLFDI